MAEALNSEESRFPLEEELADKYPDPKTLSNEGLDTVVEEIGAEKEEILVAIHSVRDRLSSNQEDLNQVFNDALNNNELDPEVRKELRQFESSLKMNAKEGMEETFTDAVLSWHEISPTLAPIFGQKSLEDINEYWRLQRVRSKRWLWVNPYVSEQQARGTAKVFYSV